MVWSRKADAAAGSIRRDAIRIYGLQALGLAFALLGSILIARVLGPSGKGVVDLFQLLNSFIVEFGFLGLNSGLLFYLINRRRALSEVHGTGVVVVVVIGTMAALAGWAGLPLWKAALPGLPTWAVVVGFGLAPPALYWALWSNLMTGLNRAVQSQLIAVWLTVLSLALLLAFWGAGALTVRTAILALAVVVLVRALVGFAVLRRSSDTLRPNAALARASLRYGLVIYVGFLANVLHFKIDQVMVNLYLGVSAVGVYAIGVRWAEMLFLLDTALISAALPRIGSEPADRSHRLTGQIFRLQLIFGVGSGLALALVAQPMVLMLYGEPYRGAVQPMLVLIPGVIAWSLAKVLSQYIVYNRGKQWIPTAFAVAGLVLNIVLNVLFIPRFGIAGAALASMLSYSFVLVLTVTAFRWLGVSR